MLRKIDLTIGQIFDKENVWSKINLGKINLHKRSIQMSQTRHHPVNHHTLCIGVIQVLCNQLRWEGGLPLLLTGGEGGGQG